MPDWSRNAEAIITEIDRERRDLRIQHLECDLGMCHHDHEAMERKSFWDLLSPVEQEHVIAIAKEMKTNRKTLLNGDLQITSISHGYGVRTLVPTFDPRYDRERNHR